MHAPFAAFRRRFETHARRPLPPCDDLPTAGPAPGLGIALLTRSLAKFQLGETGEGRIANDIDRATFHGVDDDYRAALKLFVKEEGRHARILAAIVRGLGGELLRETASSRLFTWGRRLAGIRLKLLVLLVAEVVSIVCYQTLTRRLPDGDVRRALVEIASDERAHLRFHMLFFRVHARGSRLALALFTAIACAVGVAATLVVIVDHGPLFRALGTPRRRLVRGAARMVREVVRGVWTPRVRETAASTVFA